MFECRAQLWGRLGRRAQLCGRPMTRAQAHVAAEGSGRSFVDDLGAGRRAQDLCGGRLRARAQGAGPSRRKAEGEGGGRRTFAANDLGAALGTTCREAHVAPQAYAQAHIAATWNSAAWECSGVSSKPTLRLRRLTSMSYKFCPRSLRGVSAQSWESTKRQRTYTETVFQNLSQAVPGMSQHLTGGSLKVTEM